MRPTLSRKRQSRIHAALVLPSLVRRPVAIIAFAGSATACGGSSTDVDDAPTVSIEQVLLEGAAHNTVRVLGFASDDKGLDSLRWSVDDNYQFTRILDGSRTHAFDLWASGRSPGSGIVDIEVFDTRGNSQSSSAQFEVPNPAVSINGKVLIVDGGEFKPAAGKQLCIESTCQEVNADGGVHFDRLAWKSEYAIGFIEGANRNYLVVPHENRLQPNIVNFTEEDAKAGRVPTDTQLVSGENKRKYIFYSDRTIPLQTLVDNLLNVGLSDDTRFLWTVEEGPSGRYGFAGETHRFLYPGDTITAAFSEHYTSAPDAVFDSLGVYVARGVARAQECYRKIWDEPEQYEFKMKRFSGARTFYMIAGNIVVLPSDKQTSFRVDVFGDNVFKGTDRIETLSISFATPLGMGLVRRQLESAVAAVLMGLPRLADNRFGTFLSHAGKPEDLDLSWTPRDGQLCAFTALNHLSHFTPSPQQPH